MSAATAIAARRLRRLGGLTLAHAALIVCSSAFLVPFAWLVSTSLKSDPQIFVFPPLWVPRPALWRNYIEALRYIHFVTYLRNTTYVCTLVVVGTALSSSLVAYSFSRLRWPGRDLLFLVALATMMVPFQVTLIPLVILFERLGWIGSFRPLWVPAFLGSAFFIFLLRQFFLTIPQELSDAARIDGASEFDIYWRVILPLAKPALATVVLFAFIGSWNDFLGPLIYLSDESNYTLALGLQQFQSQHGSEWAYLMAVSTVITLPVILLFFFTQRTFIRGIALTGLKG